jgi:hypothetical protein
VTAQVNDSVELLVNLGEPACVARLAGGKLEQSLGLQPQERLAHWCAGDPDRGGDLAFGDQAAAWVAAAEDLVLDEHVSALGGAFLRRVVCARPLRSR